MGGGNCMCEIGIMNLFPLILIVVGLCWGSFLNVLAYRLTHDNISFWRSRSLCPSCRRLIAWYDLIPVVSWLFLCGKCRRCGHRISWLYPFIECLTAAVLCILWYTVPVQYLFAYVLFCSALIVTVRTDAETLTIDRCCTLALIPVAWLLSYVSLLPVPLTESVLVTVFGYGVLATVRLLSRWIRGGDGIGQGDLELLAAIGAFTGLTGCWFSLVFGSIGCTLFGVFQLCCGKTTTKSLLPLGTFLALAALIVVPFGVSLTSFFFPF